MSFIDEAYTKRERRTCYGCGKGRPHQGRLSKQLRKNYGERRGRGSANLVLAINDRVIKKEDLSISKKEHRTSV